MVDAYGDARIDAQRETGLAAETFPEVCLFSFDQVISDDFWPDDFGSAERTPVAGRGARRRQE